MSKSRSKGAVKQRISAGKQEPVDLQDKLRSTIRRGLFELCVESGLQALQDILGKEMDRLVGPRYRHDQGRDACAEGRRRPPWCWVAGRCTFVAPVVACYPAGRSGWNL